ncbi:MAG: HU family DNA-binding protein [Desulfarculaceae bacterium]|nr:HU family DNA-binding protein [Desulfarculaceae bacterium]
MTLTKAALIEKLERKFEFSPQVSKNHIETLLEIMKSSFESGHDLMISGFGKFRVDEKAPRKGRTQLPAKRLP